MRNYATGKAVLLLENIEYFENGASLQENGFLGDTKAQLAFWLLNCDRYHTKMAIIGLFLISTVFCYDFNLSAIFPEWLILDINKNIIFFSENKLHKSV